MVMVREHTALTLRPRGHLFARSLTAVAIAVLPVFGVLYWLSIGSGLWPLVLIAQLLVVALYVVALLSTRSVYFRLHSWGVEDHVPFGLTRFIHTDEVDTVLLIDLYSGSGLESWPHLFAVDADDRLLLRMHGQIWSRSSIQQVASRLDAPVVHAPTPMTLAEFTSIEPQLLAWWERRPFWRRVTH